MYRDHFTELDQQLLRHRLWWQFEPFHHRHIPWTEQYADLTTALLVLSDAELSSLAGDLPALARWLSPWLDDGLRLLELSKLPRLARRGLAIAERLDYAVPGRKWQQICAFAASLPPAPSNLEWCAGKGHLGRLMAVADHCQVLGLEWQQGLCEEGHQLARRAGADMRFIQADAFSTAAGEAVHQCDRAVALHACGALHQVLMRHWVASQSCEISLSPCCYHLIAEPDYQPMSALANTSTLVLSQSNLRFCVQETVTAAGAVRRRGDREVLWRLAFDEWQREQRGIDDYLPLPNVPKKLLVGGFADFARWAARQKQLNWSGASEKPWLEVAAQRLGRVRRMELVRSLFRRPLELWLALDRVLYLQDHGAEVAIGEFCERRLTPRNILISGKKPRN